MASGTDGRAVAAAILGISQAHVSRVLKGAAVSHAMARHILQTANGHGPIDAAVRTLLGRAAALEKCAVRIRREARALRDAAMALDISN